MLINVNRFSYSETETEGVLTTSTGLRLATIERPWIRNPNGAKGGKPSESCIPNGMYRLSPHVRPSGEKCWIIFNPELGVYRFPQDHEKGKGRDLILVHSGNWVTDIIGCVAPGRQRMPMTNPKTHKMEQAVGQSGDAMELLRMALGDHQHVISFSNNAFGGSDV